MSYTVSSTSDNNTVHIEVSFTPGYTPPIITTPFPVSTRSKLTCDVCGREHKPGEGGWLSIYQYNELASGKSYNLCPECLKEIEGMINILIQVLKGERK